MTSASAVVAPTPESDMTHAVVVTDGIDVRTMRRAAVAAALLIALAVTAGCRDDADEPVAMGTIEVVEVDVAPMAPGRVTKVWIDEGDRVRPGDTLVTLTQATLAPDIEGRRARVAAA